jgi:hypothetical protein
MRGDISPPFSRLRKILNVITIMDNSNNSNIASDLRSGAEVDRYSSHIGLGHDGKE